MPGPVPDTSPVVTHDSLKGWVLNTAPFYFTDQETEVMGDELPCSGSHGKEEPLHWCCLSHCSSLVLLTSSYSPFKLRSKPTSFKETSLGPLSCNSPDRVSGFS